MPEVKSQHSFKKPILIFISIVLILITIAFVVVNPVMSLLSFQRIDDGLYAMTYYGNHIWLPKNPDRLLKIYQRLVGNFTNTAFKAVFDTDAFATVDGTGHTLLGRNQADNAKGPILFLFNKPRQGYSSVTMVNLAYLGFTDAKNLTIWKRLPLLLAPTLLFDGMNEQGLAVGISSTGRIGYADDSDREPINGFAALRLILDKAKTAKEAVQILAKYNVDFFPWPNLHILIADAEGQSVIVEFLNGEMVVTLNEEPYLVLGNFSLAQKHTSKPTENYTVINNVLEKQAGWLKLEEAMSLLEGTANPDGLHRWSVIYDTQAKMVNLVVGENYTDIHKFIVKNKKP